MLHKKTHTRRQFLKVSLKGAAAVGGFSIVPRHVLGGPGHTAPSDAITRGVIGCGGQGARAHVTANLAGYPPVTLAVSDVDKKHLARAVKKTGRACKAYTDWRRVLDRKDIDVIHIATPPHWHGLISIAAAQAGKDILCEKPMTRFIAEGRPVIEAIRRYGRVFQIGTYGRFGRFGRFGSSKQLRKLVTSDLLGGPLTLRVTRANGFNWLVGSWRGMTNAKPQRVPAELDYDMWLGPAPYKAYHPHRVHGSFRGYWDYDGGGMTDMGQHYLDPVQYILDKDDTGPVSVEAEAPQPVHPDAVGLWGKATLKYADGTTIILASGEWGRDEPAGQPLIEGPKGKVYSRGQTDPPGLFQKLAANPDPPPLIDFETAVKTRKQPGGNAESSHRSVALLHLANIAIRVGRKITWDPAAERIAGDEVANRLLNVPMRPPWHL